MGCRYLCKHIKKVQMLLIEEHIASRRFKIRQIVYRGEENVALKIEDIALIYRDDSLVVVVDHEQRKFFSHKNITELDSELDPHLFFRVNRRYILNIKYIKSFRVFERVKLEVTLTFPNTSHKIIVSQKTAPLFKKWISEE
jgi:DNA-binding LytR/AlgR family response regulator